MGALGLSLVFVGIILVLNGVNRLLGMDAKSTAVMNIITCFVSLSVNLIALTKATGTIDYQNIAAGFLFGFTYFFHAVNHLFKLDWRPFGWYSLFVAVFAAVITAQSWLAGDIRFFLIWGAWAILWLEGFFEHALRMEKLVKIYPWMSIFEGVFTAFVPALLMLTDKW